MTFSAHVSAELFAPKYVYIQVSELSSGCINYDRNKGGSHLMLFIVTASPQASLTREICVQFSFYRGQRSFYNLKPVYYCNHDIRRPLTSEVGLFFCD